MYGEQIPLFEDEVVLFNEALTALKALRLPEARRALARYGELYRGNADTAAKTAMVAYLEEGLAACPPAGPERCARLLLLWDDFAAACRSGAWASASFVAAMKTAFFAMAVREMARDLPPQTAFLTGEIPAGLIYLQAGLHEQAVRSFLESLAAQPDSARVYGYLGDAHLLRGEKETARRMYCEACLIDPAGIDWPRLGDDELLNLRRELEEDEGCDGAQSVQWLPSYAYVRGLFPPKKVGLREELKSYVDSWGSWRQRLGSEMVSPASARLFFLGIVLCDNEPTLVRIKGVAFAEVRRTMKQANASLFAAYLRLIERRVPGRS